jgi:hypothetical protein
MTTFAPGQKVVLVNDQDWLLPADPSPSPVKGQTYTVREVETFDGIPAIGLAELEQGVFFKAERFELVETKP